MCRKSLRQGVPGDLGERAGQLDAGRPAADDHERQPGAAPGRVRLALGRLEGEEHAAADLQRVLDALQARGERAPTRRGRSTSASRPWPRSGSRRGPRRRRGRPLRPARSIAVDLGQQDLDVLLAAAGCGGSARRCRWGSGRRSPPGRAGAGTGGGSGGRSRSPAPAARRNARAGVQPAEAATHDHAPVGRSSGYGVTWRGRMGIRSRICQVIRNSRMSAIQHRQGWGRGGPGWLGWNEVLTQRFQAGRRSRSPAGQLDQGGEDLDVLDGDRGRAWASARAARAAAPPTPTREPGAEQLRGQRAPGSPRRRPRRGRPPAGSVGRSSCRCRRSGRRHAGVGDRAEAGR